MKTLTLALALLLSTTFVFANDGGKKRKSEKKVVAARVLNATEVLSEITYPTELRKQAIEGTVVVTFWLDAKGEMVKHRIQSADNEALEAYVVNNLSKLQFEAARNESGQAVASRVKLPFIFNLEID